VSVNPLQASLINFELPVPIHPPSDLSVEALALRHFSIPMLGSKILGKRMATLPIKRVPGEVVEKINVLWILKVRAGQS